jgi:hypothetical protein
MAKDATKCYKMLHDLTVEQQNTIDRLVAGDTDEQAAKAAGVHIQGTPGPSGLSKPIRARRGEKI